MQRVQKVLVGVDLGSESTLVSETLRPAPSAAVSRAVQLAAVTGAELHLVSVLNIPAITTEDIVEKSAEATLREAAATALDQIGEEARAAGVKLVVTQVVAGRVWEALIRYVLAQDIDLLIVGTSSRGVASRFFFGSTTVKLLRKCPCPVWVYRPETDGHVQTILVADDFSDVGLKALHMGVSAAQLMNARLLVVHAIEFPLDRRLFRLETPDDEIEAYRQKVQRDAEEEVFERLSQTDYRTIEEGVRIEVQRGAAAVVIEEALEEHNIDLLVMGTVARGGVTGLLLGNTAEELLHRIHCSLLAIKPDDFYCPVTKES
ncbi:MAG: universal stress protein [Planctomycetaceae bacterium]